MDSEILEIFLDEALAISEEWEGVCLELRADTKQGDALKHLFRLAHNLKGSSNAMGFEKLGELIHQVEEFIGDIENNHGSIIDNNFLSFLYEVQSGLSAALKELQSQGDFDESRLKASIQSYTEKKSFSPTEGALDLRDVTASSDEPSSPQKEGHLKFQEGVHPPEKVENPLKNKEDKKESEKKHQSEVLRVHAHKVDALISSIGEITILGNMIKTFVKNRDWDKLEYILDDNEKLIKALQEKSFSLRMNNLRGLFQRLHRAGKEISLKQDKDIQFKFIGEDVELDRFVIDEIAEVMTHIIRNSVDHGIENKNERAQTKKNEPPSILIHATNEGDSVVIKIKDNGRGIDSEKVFKKAVEKGLVTEGGDLSHQEKVQLIFHSGLSTADQVTDVSGRGVGMDAVKEKVESLEGEVKLKTVLGEGTELNIVLPTSLSILDGFVFSHQKKKYIIPLAKIDEIVKSDEINITENISGDLYGQLRGETIYIKDICEFIEEDKEQHQQNKCISIFKRDGITMGLILPRYENIQQIVVRKLQGKFEGFSYLKGMTILGDGGMGLILDIQGIMNCFYDSILKGRAA